MTMTTTTNPSPVGVTRRLRALVADGWDFPALATQLGLSEQVVRYYTHQAQATTPSRITGVVCDLYNHLRTTPGPSDVARRYAHRQGWADTAYWDDYEGVRDIDDPDAAVQPVEDPDPTLVDWVAVDRALRGVRICLTPAERVAAVQIGLARGMRGWRVADALCMSTTTLNRLATPVDVAA